MTRVRNANEFVVEFRGIWGRCNQMFGRHLAEVRKRYALTPQERILHQSLEMHVRACTVNTLLAALIRREGEHPFFLTAVPEVTFSPLYFGEAFAT